MKFTSRKCTSFIEQTMFFPDCKYSFSVYEPAFDLKTANCILNACVGTDKIAVYENLSFFSHSLWTSLTQQVSYTHFPLEMS